MERKGKLSLDFAFNENGEMLGSSPVLESSTKKITLVELDGYITWSECAGSEIDTMHNMEDYVYYMRYHVRKLNSVQKIAKLHFIIIPVITYE